MTEESEGLFQQIVESAPDAMVAIDDRGCILVVNAQTEKLFGYSRAELLGQSLEILLPERFRSDHLGHRARYFANSHVRPMEVGPEIRGLRKDGNEFPIDISLNPITLDERTFAVSAIREISDRKQAAQVCEERNWLRTLIDSLPDFIYVKNRQGRFVTNNLAHARFVGVNSPAEMVGKTDFDFFEEKLAEKHYSDEQLIMESGVALMDYEEGAVDSAGNRHDVLTHKIPLRDAEGEVTGLVGVSRNITQRKRAERQVQKIVEDLEESKQMTDQQAEHMRSLAEELAQSNQELQQFAYVASHDLKEPLRMVTGYTQLLARRYKGKLDADADEFIGYAVDAAARMQTLIDNLLAYSRVGRRGKKFRPADCEAVFGRALNNLGAAVEESGASVKHDPLPTVMADETQLDQLFQNLIGNAIKFCDKHAPCVEVKAEPRGSEWVFAVSDNGIGIEPRYHNRVFEMFQRLHVREEYSGTGIGLAICKKIVERHGGRIWVDSIPGEGSSFCFTLPKEAVPIP